MWKTCAAVAAALVLGGCVSPYSAPTSVTASVESSVRPGFDPAAVHLVSPGDAVQRFDPDFDRTVLAVRSMLVRAGFTVLPPDQAPTGREVLVTIAYFSDPAEGSSYTSQRPIYAETGVASSRTVERVNKKGEKISTTTYEPRTSVVGYEDVEGTSWRYPYRLALKGFDQAELKRNPKFTLPLWSVEVSAYGGENDRTRLLPFLLNAAGAYVGKPSGPVRVVAAGDDPSVALIRAQFQPRGGAGSPSAN